MIQQLAEYIKAVKKQMDETGRSSLNHKQIQTRVFLTSVPHSSCNAVDGDEQCIPELDVVKITS